MNEAAREYTGVWEEIAAHDAELRGHQVQLTVLDATNGEAQTVQNDSRSQRPAPAHITTPGKNAEGIVTDVDAFFAGLPTVEDDGELWSAIAESRAMRRQITADQDA